MDITPDSADWTWVLSRPCAQCGFDASQTPAAGVAGLLRSAAGSWQAVLARPDVGQRPRGDVWSALEYGCHVRDVCVLFDQRLRLMLDSTDPTFANWDQDRTAIKQRYAEQDPALVSEQLATAAAVLADRFAAVGGAQWRRTGRRSDGAEFTVESFARYFVHDVIHHLHDVGAEPTPDSIALPAAADTGST
ncbi:MAG: DinB family protein [Actinomycetota bacterium]|nr:DinB family protein [Actinomycetota bacterium]